MISDQPIHQVEWIPIEKVHANDYNPNSVATQEMKLLYRSVKADGYTQPVVTIYDEKKDRYVIVDGFHRYSIMRRFKDIYASCEGKLPCVVLHGKTMNDLMASTVRHNRARGKHSINGMSNIVMEMLKVDTLGEFVVVVIDGRRTYASCASEISLRPAPFAEARGQ